MFKTVLFTIFSLLFVAGGILLFVFMAKIDPNYECIDSYDCLLYNGTYNNVCVLHDCYNSCLTNDFKYCNAPHQYYSQGRQVGMAFSIIFVTFGSIGVLVNCITIGQYVAEKKREREFYAPLMR